MIIDEPYNSWLNEKVGNSFDENTKFVMKIAATTANGVEEINVALDPIWFILIHVEDTEAMKLQVVQVLIRDPNFATQFQATLDNPQVKRLIAEFLLYNFTYLDGLKEYVDFNKLDAPIDFVSHALLLKRGSGVDSDQISLDRLRIVSLVIDNGFNLSEANPLNTELPVLNKVLSMNLVEGKFEIAQKLLNLGFKLFVNNNPRANMEVAISLINLREQPQCQQWISSYIEQFRTIKVQIPGSNDAGNLADFYYWVKEDMEAVHFIRETLGIQLSSTT